jgi:hypothetical protein
MATTYTDEELRYHTLILLDIGDNDDSGPVANNITALWDIFNDRYGSDKYLTYLYVKRKAIDIWLGSIWKGNYVPVGTVQHKALDDKANQLRAMRNDVQDEIDGYMTIGRINLDFLEPSGGEF